MTHWTLNHRKEIDRLYALDYGDRIEFAFRLILSASSAVIHMNYTNMTLALIWLQGFIAAHLLYFVVLTTRPAEATARDTLLAGLIFLVLLCAFIWFPVYMIAQDDMAVRMSGIAGIGALLMFLIQRSDTMKWMVLSEIALVTLAVGFVLLREMQAMQDVGARLVTGFAGVTLISYFTRTILDHRLRRLAAEAAANRSVQAQRMEAVGQLAGGVAHDFNNILTAVTGNLDLYDAVQDPEERRQFIAEARQSADRAAGLVGQLLAYSRKTTLTVADHDMSEVFARINVLSRRLLPSSVALHIAPPSEPLLVRVDQNQLITAMINLMINARDALAGAGHLSISAMPERLDHATPMLDGALLEAGCYVRIAICDDGPGIPRDILRRVTEPFFTTKGIGEGSGLGLSMVEGFARQSHGGLTISTSPDGTEATLWLPCARQLAARVADDQSLAGLRAVVAQRMPI